MDENETKSEPVQEAREEPKPAEPDYSKGVQPSTFQSEHGAKGRDQPPQPAKDW